MQPASPFLQFHADILIMHCSLSAQGQPGPQAADDISSHRHFSSWADIKPAAFHKDLYIKMTERRFTAAPSAPQTFLQSHSAPAVMHILFYRGFLHLHDSPGLRIGPWLLSHHSACLAFKGPWPQLPLACVVWGVVTNVHWPSLWRAWGTWFPNCLWSSRAGVPCRGCQMVPDSFSVPESITTKSFTSDFLWTYQELDTNTHPVRH